LLSGQFKEEGYAGGGFLDPSSVCRNEAAAKAMLLVKVEFIIYAYMIYAS
jgi:hypothetical protein